MSTESPPPLRAKVSPRRRTHDWVVRARARRIERRAIARQAKRLAVGVVKLAASTVSALLTALFDPLVVVTMMTTLSLIIGLLAYASTAPGGRPSREIILLCWVIGLFGLFTVLLQVYKILKRDAARKKLGEFWIVGHNLLTRCRQKEEPFDALGKEADTWAADVEKVLRKKLGESYVAKFRSGVNILATQPNNLEPPYINLWWGINSRLIWLDRFSKELGKE